MMNLPAVSGKTNFLQSAVNLLIKGVLMKRGAVVVTLREMKAVREEAIEKIEKRAEAERMAGMKIVGTTTTAGVVTGPLAGREAMMKEKAMDLLVGVMVIERAGAESIRIETESMEIEKVEKGTEDSEKGKIGPRFLSQLHRLGQPM